MIANLPPLSLTRIRPPLRFVSVALKAHGIRLLAVAGGWVAATDMQQTQWRLIKRLLYANLVIDAHLKGLRGHLNQRISVSSARRLAASTNNAFHTGLRVSPW